MRRPEPQVSTGTPNEDMPQAQEDLVDAFIWRLVLDPDAYYQVARLLGEATANAIVAMARAYTASIDGTTWLAHLHLTGASD